jgi:hypothetical protein
MGGKPPAWVSVLMLAEKWGSPPWVITGETLTNEVRIKWYLRGQLYVSQMNIRDNQRFEGLINAR